MKHHSLRFPPDLDDLESLTILFQALSDKTRLSILVCLHHDDLKVGDIQERLQLPQSTVSRHLSLLRAARLVQAKRQGTQVVYSLRTSHISDLLHQAFSHAEHQRLRLPDHHGTESE